MAIAEPTNLLLLACALIYALIGEPQEALILLLFVAAISLLDAWQQHRSRRALAELGRLSSPRARVRRDGLDLDWLQKTCAPAMGCGWRKGTGSPPMHGCGKGWGSGWMRRC